jgi:hypothetical protein
MRRIDELHLDHAFAGSRMSASFRTVAADYAGSARTRQQHNPRTTAHPDLGFPRTSQPIQNLAFLGRQRIGVAAGMIFIPSTNHDSRFSDSGY